MSDEPETPETRSTPLDTGLIDDPKSFELGYSEELGNAILLVFLNNGEPSQALAFRGEAKEKLLQSFYAYFKILAGTATGQERPGWTVPEKSKPTLH